MNINEQTVSRQFVTLVHMNAMCSEISWLEKMVLGVFCSLNNLECLVGRFEC